MKSTIRTSGYAFYFSFAKFFGKAYSGLSNKG